MGYPIDNNARVTPKKLRQDLFRIVDRAIEGEPIEFTHEGVVLRIVPEAVLDKLARLTRQPVLAPRTNRRTSNKSL